MDHETSVRMKAPERYILGELTGADRDSFEEHFFECPECAEDVRALTVFRANARAIFQDGDTTPVVPAGALLANRALWFSAMLNGVLAIGLGIALFKGAPEKRRELADARAPQFVQNIPVLEVARGADTPWGIASTTRNVVF